MVALLSITPLILVVHCITAPCPCLYSYLNLMEIGQRAEGSLSKDCRYKERAKDVEKQCAFWQQPALI